MRPVTMVTGNPVAQAKATASVAFQILKAKLNFWKFTRSYTRLTMLPEIQSLRTAAVLEDCAHQLAILGHSLSVQIRRERNTAPVQEKARLIMLKKECQLITQHISTLFFELEEKGSFSSFPQAVEEKKKLKDERQKREEETMLKQKKQALKRQELEIMDKKDQLHKMDFLLDELKYQRSKMQKNYKPETVGMSQQMITEKWQIAQLKDQLELLQKQLGEEKRFHEESKNFLQNQDEELQQTLHKWKQQTKQIQNDTQKKLDNIGCKRTLNLDRLMEMRRKFREMEQVVMEDKKEQQKLRQQETEARAATKLQAWWRACMVRQGFGAFKKADEIKKGNKRKGKKK
ncbi:dynein regulatory complex protein 9 isoform X1 [Girardinichthys multiradiatus]|uniref:dynein regulatory complex protein 9 isoform X1 n=1 Tax=Girardinichthys multiradiatus TaxID=208333 RepID=UPI001FADE9DC|nr:dynein regulatory complex protein 9 isoform X1 [Girardinichthys multiradiatus]